MIFSAPRTRERSRGDRNEDAFAWKNYVNRSTFYLLMIIDDKLSFIVDYLVLPRKFNFLSFKYNDD